MKRIVFLIFIILLTNVVVAQGNFNVIVDIPKSYSILKPGDEIIASIKLINLGGTKREDVTLECWVSEPGGSKILKRTETVAVETQANFVRGFNLPKDIEPGTYKFSAKITYSNGNHATGEHSFQVVEKKLNTNNYYIIIGSVILLVIIIIVLIKSKPIIEKLKIRHEVAKIVKERMKE